MHATDFFLKTWEFTRLIKSFLCLSGPRYFIMVCVRVQHWTHAEPVGLSLDIYILPPYKQRFSVLLLDTSVA